ncbi:MAG: hypothetical protein Q9161_006480 [Pseudevernia consocians]
MAKITVQGARSSATPGYAPEEMQYQLTHFILLTVFSGFATIAVGLRFWARRMQTQALALHDYLILLGLVFGLAETGVNAYGNFAQSKQRVSGPSTFIDNYQVAVTQSHGRWAPYPNFCFCLQFFG